MKIMSYEDLDKIPQRVTTNRILEMLKYLQSKKFKVEAWKRTDKPHWRIQCNHWVWQCRSHLEAFNHLYPFYYEEKQKAYAEEMKERGQRLKKELDKEKEKNGFTKLL